jgi:valyl-tRNA synthetase
MNLEGADGAAFDAGAMRLEDRWVLSRLERARGAVAEALEGFHFQAALAAAYTFFWDELCDWYLEAVKPRLASPEDRGVPQRVLAFVLDRALRMLHPFVPFITEAAWEGLSATVRDRSLPGLAEAPPSERLIVAAWPGEAAACINEEAETTFAAAREVVRAVRNIRNKAHIPPGLRLKVLVRTDAAHAAILAETADLVRHLAVLETVEAGPDVSKPAHAATEVVPGAEVYVSLEGLIDLESERRRIEERIAKEKAYLAQVEKKLSNTSFVDRAPAEVVQRERDRAAEIRAAIESLQKHLAELA